MERLPSTTQEAKEEEIEINGFVNEIRNMSAEQILEHFQRGFVEGIKHFDVRTLVAYIDAGKIDIEKNRTLAPEVKEQIAAIKRDPNYKKVLIVSPKLYFMTARECAEMALKELVRRAQESE